MPTRVVRFVRDRVNTFGTGYLGQTRLLPEFECKRLVMLGDAEYVDGDSPTEPAPAERAPAKKKRGRPRKKQDQVEGGAVDRAVTGAEER